MVGDDTFLENEEWSFNGEMMRKVFQEREKMLE
jgi:hypothetical protein